MREDHLVMEALNLPLTTWDQQVSSLMHFGKKDMQGDICQRLLPLRHRTIYSCRVQLKRPATIVLSLKDVIGHIKTLMVAKEIVVGENKKKPQVDQLLMNSFKMHSHAEMISTCVILMKIHQIIR